MSINYAPDNETPEEVKRQIEYAERELRPLGIPAAVKARFSKQSPEPGHEPTQPEPARLLIEGEADALALLADLAQRLGLTATLLSDSADELPDETAEAPAPTGYRRSDHFGWARDVLEVGPDLFKDDDVN